MKFYVTMVLTSKLSNQLTKKLSLKLTRDDIKVIINWLIVRNTNGKLCNFLLYIKRNKAEIARQLSYNIELE